MKTSLFFIPFTFVLIAACQTQTPKNTSIITQKDSTTVQKVDTLKTHPIKETSFLLALSANAIQIVNQTTGATTEIGFGLPLAQVVTTAEKVLKSKASLNTNTECGAGPLKIATWQNGLTLLFQEKQNEWFFVGWALNQTKNPAQKLTTMAGIGIGSTRKEMESAYVIKVNKTTLGYEFATKSNDLFGIFDGANENAKITNMWSGVSCNFR